MGKSLKVNKSNNDNLNRTSKKDYKENSDTHNVDDLERNNTTSDCKKEVEFLHLYKKVLQWSLQFLPKTVIFNSLRVIIVLGIIAIAYFRLVAPHDSIIMLEASWNTIEEIEAQGISLDSFEADSLIFNDYDAIIISLEDNFSIEYNNKEYDDSYTFVFYSTSSSLHFQLEGRGIDNIEGYRSPFVIPASDAYNIPKSVDSENNVVTISSDSKHTSTYYDYGFGKYYNLKIFNNRWGISYQFLRDEPCNISSFKESLYVDIYKDNELVVKGKEAWHGIEIPSIRGIIIRTYGNGYMYLSEVKSCKMEIEKAQRISFTGSGNLKYYYTSEQQTDSFDNYDIELESNEGFNGTLMMPNEKTTKLQVSGNAKDVKYFGRSLFPTDLEWLRANVWTLPISLITIISAAVSLIKKDNS